MNNLKSLIMDMKNLGWVIECFPFSYNQVDCIVVLKIYQEGERKPNEYAQANIEFIRSLDNEVLKAYVNYSSVNFFNPIDFYRFFKINDKNSSGNSKIVFMNFSNFFIQQVPEAKRLEYANNERNLMSRRLDTKNSNGVYCRGVKRNEEGHTRSIENANKTMLLRPELFEFFKRDETISFVYSEDASREKDNTTIIENFAKLHGNGG